MKTWFFGKVIFYYCQFFVNIEAIKNFCIKATSQVVYYEALLSLKGLFKTGGIYHPSTLTQPCVEEHSQYEGANLRNIISARSAWKIMQHFWKKKKWIFSINEIIFTKWTHTKKILSTDIWCDIFAWFLLKI